MRVSECHVYLDRSWRHSVIMSNHVQQSFPLKENMRFLQFITRALYCHLLIGDSLLFDLLSASDFIEQLFSGGDEREHFPKTICVVISLHFMQK